MINRTLVLVIAALSCAAVSPAATPVDSEEAGSEEEGFPKGKALPFEQRGPH